MAMLAFEFDTHLYLTQGFWPSRRVKKLTMLFNNRDMCEEFAMDELYVGLACNRCALSFGMPMDCYEDYLVFKHARYEEHPKTIWFMKALFP